MSKPCKIDKSNPVQSVAGEIIDAISCLNMEPCPIKPDKVKDVYYLSDLDAWAKHAVEHLRQAFAGTKEVHKYIDQLQRENYLLRERLIEMKQKTNQ
ncbi:MAG: hypothetical protein WC455_30780 [Dehalococcoidia bacterium]